MNEDKPSANPTEPTERPAVSLTDVLFEMEGQPEEWSAYVNLKTGEVFSLPHDAFSAAETIDDDEQYYGDADDEMIALASKILETDDFKALPDQFEIHEWAIMRDFSASIEDEDCRGQLLDAIHGSGAFRFFKSTVDRLGLRDAWFAFRDSAIERIAIDWLEENEIPWTREQASKESESES